MHQPSSPSDDTRDLESIINSIAAEATGPKARGSIGSGSNALLLEEYYEQWRLSPQSVDPAWRGFFEGFELGCQQKPPKLGEAESSVDVQVPKMLDPSETPFILKQARVYNLLFAYRTLGHHLASLDPLELGKPIDTELDIKYFKLSDEDLDTVFDSGKLAGGGERTLREILSILRKTYCGNIGVEYMHMQDFERRRWLRDRMETCLNQPSFSDRKKRRILNRVLASELFETFLHTRYVGQKRFSLEGGETLIPMLDAIIENCPKLGIGQIVMGMAHRGRLNVLANILNKSYMALLNEFADNFTPESVQGDGDVKYHLGLDTTVTTSSGDQVGFSLAPNPSHLEAVNPVVQGKARAWQRKLEDTKDRSRVLPVLIHGDAAMIGQGVVQETLNLSQLQGYKTGGTVHVVINNQIGFTTLPADSRSSIYCTSIAKMLGVPIFHVNGDDPLSAVLVIEMALEFRQTFHRDIVIDLYCYRRHGHNEGDEPNFTQPTLYSEITSHPRVSELLIPKMVADGSIERERAEEYVTKFQQQLDDALKESKAAAKKFKPSIRKPLATPELLDPVDTSLPLEHVQRVGEALCTVPENFQINNKLKRWIGQRRDMNEGKRPVDWGFAEALAFGTLLDQGNPIRLSGQDSRRGTFSHRHSVFYDVNTRERYIPLKHISTNQGSFCVYNSPLSEAAVLGFDFGYSLDYPKMLCIWEAQFGDFANGAQVMIDQYITSSESKWGVSSGIVMLLPHGYQGQGPEHSSARLERFLQACAEDNMVVANCTTPASFYHLMRRQALREITKPLIVMTPKSLLRSKHAVSTIEELANAPFQEVLPDTTADKSKVKRLILCTGKVYYDLHTHREDKSIEDAAIVRMEQIYPVHEPKLQEIKASYPNLETVVWCQEESYNMGSYFFLQPRLRKIFGKEIHYAGRDASASPATGFLAIHNLEQEDLVNQAFSVS